MEQRTPEEEVAYQRYLKKRIRMRKRRRQVYIARAIVACLGVAIIAVLVIGVRGIVHLVSEHTTEKAQSEEKPTATPFVVDVPEGYEEVYQKLYAMREEYAQMDDILISMERYPKELLELLAKNQETIDFVSDYLKHVDDTKPNGEISEEEMSQVIPLFLQWDKRWGYVKYGSSILAITGCGPTCMSMVYTGLTEKQDRSPAEMADFCTENDYYSEDSGTSWSLMLNGAQKLGLEVQSISLGESNIKEELEKGHPLICSMKPGDFTTSGHFIVLRGITEAGKLLLNDPNSREHSEKEWEFETVYQQIKAIWAYSYQGE